MKLHFTTTIHKEGKYFVARCVELGVVSQGKSIEEAQKNIKEATELYLERMPNKSKKIFAEHSLITSFDLEYA